MAASAMPRELRIAGTNEIRIEDILVGEARICGGQSNMEWTVDQSGDPARERAEADRPTLRVIKAPRVTSNVMREDIAAEWTICSPETVGGFTAVGYAFGRELRDALDVPVGLLSINWGGTRIEPWISSRSLLTSGLSRDRMLDMEAERKAFESMSEAERFDRDQLRRNEHAREIATYLDRQQQKDPGTRGRWMLPGNEPAAWTTVRLPRLWRDTDSSLADFDGAVWYRRTINVPDDWAGRNLLLELGPIDDSDIIWFNGVRIASTIEASAEPRRYRVPAGIVKPGKTTITVMAIDAGGAGGFPGPAELMKIGPIDRMATMKPSVSMAGEWEWRRGGEHVGGRPRPAPVSSGSPGSSSSDYAALHNGMIAPFTPFAVRGAIWYQGESNDGEPDRYRTFLPMLITDWKRSFERSEFPFGIVQLAAYKAERDDLPAEGGWALLRDAQAEAALEIPQVGLVVTTDIGDANDIHPRNKREVGRRMSLWALADAYGRAVPGSESPRVEAVSRIEGPEGVMAFRITVDDSGGGLKTANEEPPRGFAVSGPSGEFRWAEARLEPDGRSIVVWSPEVPNPVGICFAWQNNPVRANVT
ncbi:MAG: hypothetical protein GY895_10055, partial [Phycisphaera sp.]|nr:hypothetical protein [Phycisphaera sp.]